MKTELIEECEVNSQIPPYIDTCTHAHNPEEFV